MLVGLGVAAPAHAGTIVWNGGGSIWMANDELTVAAPVVSPGSVGMNSLGQPHVQPGGGTTVVFQGSTNQNSHYYQGTFHCGFSCTGVYRRTGDGSVARLSGAPFNGDGTVTSFDTEPEIGTNGRYAYSFFLCTGYVSTQPFTYSCTNQLRHENVNNTDDQNFGAVCSNPNLGGPSPRPAVVASEVIYTGCTNNGTPGLVIAGPNNANGRWVGFDDALMRDPSFRADGQRWVDAEDGSDPGLWDAGFDQVYNYLLPQPAGYRFSSPRYAGVNQDRIIFAAATSTSVDLWTVPTSCRANSCSFPASATRITTGGGNTQPAWTSATLISPPSGGGGGGGSVGGSTEMPSSGTAPGSTQPGGDTTGGGANMGGGGETQTPPETRTETGTPAGGGQGGSNAAPAELFTTVVVPRRGFSSRNGASFGVTLAQPASVSITIDRLRGRRLKRVGAVRFRGRAGRNTFRVRRVKRRALAPGSYRGTIVATANGASTRRAVPFRITR